MYFYFYSSQSNFMITANLKILCSLSLSITRGAFNLILGLLGSIVFLRLVEGGLIWFRVGGIYFLGLTHARVILFIVMTIVYVRNLSSLAVVTLILGFPLTIIFFHES